MIFKTQYKVFANALPVTQDYCSSRGGHILYITVNFTAAKSYENLLRLVLLEDSE